MKHFRELSILLFSILLFACGDHVTFPKEKRLASARVTVKVGGVGTLGKRADITFARLLVTLSSSGEPTLRDTFSLSGNGQATVTRIYDNLAASKSWTLSASSFDLRDSLIHSGSSNFVPVAGLTTDLSVSLDPRFAMLKAIFFPIPDSVTRCQLQVDSVTRGDSLFPNQSMLGDTMQLGYDYVTTGRSHSIRLNAFGDSAGGHRLLYRADTAINVLSGVNGYFRVVLKRIAPPAPTSGGIVAHITLGRVWSVLVDGVFEDSATGPSGGGAVRNISGVYSQPLQVWSRDTLYRIVGNALIDSACSLSVAAGTRVEFMNNAYLEVRGKLTAMGSSTDSIRFMNGNLRLNTRGGSTFDSLGNYRQGPRFEYCSFSNSTLHVMNPGFSNGWGPYLTHSYLKLLQADGFGYASGMYIANSRIEILGSSDLELNGSVVTNSHIGTFRVNGYSGPMDINNNAIDTLSIDRWRSTNKLEMNALGYLEWNRPSTSGTAFLHNNNILGLSGELVFRITSSDETAPVNATNNYWGGLTSEIVSKGANANISGLHDFQDDFSLVRIDYSGWAESPISGAGPDW